MISFLDKNTRETILFFINADWYFDLHWLNRALFLKEHGYNIHVATNFKGDNLENKFHDMGLYCHHISLKRRSLNPIEELKTCYGFYKICKKVNPTYIHCVTIKPNLYGGFITSLLKKKVIFTIPGFGTVFSSKQWHFKMMWFLITWVYRLIARITQATFVFENNDNYQLFCSNGVIKKSQGVVINGSGVSIEQFPYSELSVYNTVLFAARLLKEKGLLDLLEAVKKLKYLGHDITLNVAGLLDLEASDAIPVSQLEQWHQEGVINWLGSCSDMPEQIRKASLVCLPTTYGEGVPRILIESASCGRGIVATDVIGCRDIALDGYNARLVPPGDVEALSRVLLELLSDRKKLIEFGLNGRKLVIEKFIDDIVLKRTLELYKNNLSSHSPC